MSFQTTIDITPDPRILRVLGEIPFHPWQCIAELLDNSLDAFASAERQGRAIDKPRIDILWSEDNVASADRTLEVIDNGVGMDLDAITAAVTAGYSSNDPMNNLGLFGMGFNIATARLGETTRFLSMRTKDDRWTGVEIDFDTLSKKQEFVASVIHKSRYEYETNGTKVQVLRLKEGIYRRLRDNAGALKRTLEDVYSPILRDGKISVYINGKALKPRPYCVWSEKRYVTRRTKKTLARVQIEHEFDPSLFDLDRNQYLPGSLEAKYRARLELGEPLPQGIVERSRRLHGWIGIQRYADPNSFGLDFVRNGRKILIKNKDLFSWYNPLNGESILEYPVELGSTQGGRIVGELHVDYLIPTYQKNDFDRTEAVWNETVLAIRGDGPMLPKRRKNLGYPETSAPLAQLVNAYRRLDPGTKNLAIQSATAKEWLVHFYKGDKQYTPDDRWWQAAVEIDRSNADGGAGSAMDVDTGAQPSDNPDTYGPSSATTEQHAQQRIRPSSNDDSTLTELIQRSREVASLSGDYKYQNTSPLKVRVHELGPDGQILRNGKCLATRFFQAANECDFFYDPRHELLRDFPLSERDILTLYVAESLKTRDTIVDIAEVFQGIYLERFSDSKIERLTLQERAERLVDDIRAGVIEHLSARAVEVLSFVHESSGEVEATISSLLFNDPELVEPFQRKEHGAIGVLEHVPSRTLARIVEQFPEDLLDNRLFRVPFNSISFEDENAVKRARGEAKKKLLSNLEDAVALTSGGMANPSKDELGRASYSLCFLERMLVE